MWSLSCQVCSCESTTAWEGRDSVNCVWMTEDFPVENVGLHSSCCSFSPIHIHSSLCQVRGFNITRETSCSLFIVGSLIIVGMWDMHFLLKMCEVSDSWNKLRWIAENTCSAFPSVRHCSIWLPWSITFKKYGSYEVIWWCFTNGHEVGLLVPCFNMLCTFSQRVCVACLIFIKDNRIVEITCCNVTVAPPVDGFFLKCYTLVHCGCMYNIPTFGYNWIWH